MSLLRHHQLLMSRRAAYDATILADNPAGYWKLDETSGAIAYDSSGNGKNGGWTQVGSAAQNQSPLVSDGGLAYSVVGGSYLNFGADWAPTLAEWRSWTFEGWFRFNAVTEEMNIVTKWGKTTSDDITLFVWIKAGKFQFLVNTIGAGGGEKTLNSVSSVATGVLYHLCFSYNFDTKRTRIYINGNLDAESPVLGGSQTDLGLIRESLSVGAKIYNGVPEDMTGRYGNFTCDNLALYRTALTTAQVAAHYAAGT